MRLCESVYLCDEMNIMDGKLKQEKQQAMQIQNKAASLTLRSANEDVKLAAVAISFNVRLRSSDMPTHMQEHALRSTRSLLDSVVSTKTTTKTRPKPNPTHLARALKKEFDLSYGPAWHCVVGASFGSFVTHSPGGFVYFSIDSLSVLLFQTEVKLVTEAQQQLLLRN